MTAHGVVLLIIALLELLLGLYIYNRDRKNAVNITFLLLTIGVLFWVSANSVLAFPTMSVDFWYRLAYSAGIIICSSFLYFSWVFPYRLIFTNWLRKLITIVPIAVFVYLFFLTDTLIVDVKKTDLIAVVNYGNLFALYMIVFVVYFGWAFYSLIRKYQRSNGMHRWQLKYVILSALIPVVINFITDIVLPWAGYSRQPWMVYIGAELSVVWLGLTAYVAFKKKVI